MHTHDYRNHKGLEDKNVVVVGIGNSGGDVSVDLSRIAKQVYLSTRRGSWVLNRITDNGVPLDIATTRRVIEALRRLLGKLELNMLIYLFTFFYTCIHT